jgi:hypothetical protein
MARGYMLSGCFMCASLNEVALFAAPSFNASNETPNQYSTLERLKVLRVCMFSSLATLSSILAFPLFILFNLYSFASWKKAIAKTSRCESLRLYAAIALICGTSVLSIYTFLAIKSSSVGMIVSPAIAFNSWFIGLPMLLCSPVFSVVNAIDSSSPLFAKFVFCASTVSIILAI